MNKLLFFCATWLTLNSCMTSTSPLIEFSKPTSGKVVENEVFKFEISMATGCSNISYKLENKLDKNLEIDWNRASFIVEGEAFRVYEGNMKGIDSNKEQLNLLIPSKAFKRGVIVSGKNMVYSSSLGWTGSCFLDGPTKSLVGKSFLMRQPVKIDGNFKDYEFEIKVIDIIKLKQNILLN